MAYSSLLRCHVTTSYMFFLFLIVVHGQVEQGKLCRERISDHEAVRTNFFHLKDNFTSDLQDFDKMCIRNYTTAVMEVCILLWISGLYTVVTVCTHV